MLRYLRNRGSFFLPHDRVLQDIEKLDKLRCSVPSKYWHSHLKRNLNLDNILKNKSSDLMCTKTLVMIPSLYFMIKCHPYAIPNEIRLFQDVTGEFLWSTQTDKCEHYSPLLFHNTLENHKSFNKENTWTLFGPSIW